MSLQFSGSELPSAGSHNPYQVVRLTTLVGPVVPVILLTISVMLTLSASAAALGLTPASDQAVAIVLLCTAAIITVLAAITRYASQDQRVDLGGVSCVLAATTFCGGICVASYISDLGITVALPYCILMSLGATFFWVRTRYLFLGLIGCFAPPMALLFATDPSPMEWSFSIQIGSATAILSVGIYVLINRTNRQLFSLGEELQHRATFDGLTGALNRATWVTRAEQSLAADQLAGRPTSCLFLDMDRFKQVNDALGHEAGDGVLGQVASVLHNHASADQLVGRIGGDEFVMLLPHTGFDQASELADRILAKLQAALIAPSGPVASIGVACASSKEALSELVQRADLDMMRVKERHHDLDYAHDSTTLRDSRRKFVGLSEA